MYNKLRLCTKWFLGSFILSIFIAPLFLVPLASGAIFAPSAIDSNGNVSGAEYLELIGAPGKTIIGQVSIASNSDEAGYFEAALVDAFSTEDSERGFLLKGRDDEQSTIGAWGVIEPSEGDLEAFDYAIVDVEFTIPEDVELGTYWGALLARDSIENQTGEGGGGAANFIENGVRVKIEVVSVEDFVPVEREEYVPAEGEEPEGLPVYTYIIAGLIIVVAAGVIGYANMKK
jgi:hypothetical protein